jgi:hypothetical protein
MKEQIKHSSMVVKAYLDYGSATEWVATFSSDHTYRECLDVLEKLAKEHEADLVESFEYEDGKDDFGYG